MLEESGKRRSLSPFSGGLRGGPTLLRMLVGAHLRRLRQAGDITLGQAAWSVGATADEMELLERGRVTPRANEVAELLTRYGVSDAADREAVLNLVRDAGEPVWWQRYGDVMPGWLEILVGLEQSATSIRGYEVQHLPSLLQTEAYARATIEHAHFTRAEVEQRVALRMRRQLLLAADDGPNYWVVVEEATLRRCVGGAEVMRDQLGHLLDVTERPNVTLQIVPLVQCRVAAVGGPFTLLRFAEPELPDVVHLAHLTGAVYVEDESEVAAYRVLIDRLGASALTPRRSLDLVAALAAES